MEHRPARAAPTLAAWLLVSGWIVDYGSAGYTDRDLFRLASEGNAAEVQRALAAGASPDGYLNPRGTSALAKVVTGKDEDTDLAGLLLEHGADINLKSKAGWCPLYLACKAHRKAMIKFLLDRGADPNIQDKGGHTPLMALFQNPRGTELTEEIARVLLAAGADPQLKTYERGWIALHFAGSNSHDEAYAMLDKVSDGSIDPKDEMDPRIKYIWDAAYEMDVDVKHTVEDIRGWLESGVDPDGYYDGRGSTALHKAVVHEKLDLIELLLEFKADPNRQTREVLGTYGQDTPADDNQESKASTEGYSPVHLAASGGHAKIITMLLDSGGDINIADARGKRPLHWAAYNNHVEAVTLLIKSGADVNALDLSGRSAMDVALLRGAGKGGKGRGGEGIGGKGGGKGGAGKGGKGGAEMEAAGKGGKGGTEMEAGGKGGKGGKGGIGGDGNGGKGGDRIQDRGTVIDMLQKAGAKHSRLDTLDQKVKLEGEEKEGFAEEFGDHGSRVRPILHHADEL